MLKSTAHIIEEKERTKDIQIQENVNFTSMLLSENVLNGLLTSGFTRPSPIQLKAVPLGRCGFDLIIKAKSGTGKTAVFSIIALESIDVTVAAVQVLILAPTREIAVQIKDVICSIGSAIAGLNVEYFIGGLPIEDDLKKLRHCHIAIGAPGRVKHLIDKGSFNTSRIHLFVLDEADKLMEDNFQGDINAIYNQLPEKKQMIAASATYPDALDTFISKYMLSPTFVTPENNEISLLLGIRQFVSVVKSHLNIIQQINIKNEELIRILSNVSFTQCLVFSNYQTQAESISNFLNKHEWNSVFISGSQSQNERLLVMNKLKEFKCRILLTTDLTARGIDAANVDLVINYHVPVDSSTYLHRMGRAGRYGAKGICITLASEGTELISFQKHLGTIGGSQLSAAKLPQDATIKDAWQIDLSNLEQIYGICDSDVENISTAVEEVKKTSLENSQNKKNKKKKRKAKKGADEVTDILEALDVSGDKDENKKTKPCDTVVSKNDLNIDDLSPKDNLKSTLNCDNTKKKLKVDSVNMENNANIDIMSKNIALFNTARLVSNQNYIDNEVSDDIKEQIKILQHKYQNDDLNLLEKKENYEHLSAKDIIQSVINNPNNISVENQPNQLKPISRLVEEVASKSKEEKPYFKVEENLPFPDNIFELAYKSALGQSKLHWKSYCQVTNNSVQQVEPNIKLMEQTPPVKIQEIVHTSSDQHAGEIGQWMEVVKESSSKAIAYQEDAGIALSSIGEWVEVSKDCNNKYENYFNHYEQTLEYYGPWFEDLASFDTWFSQWCREVRGVREYVQQNIYLEEMNKYKYS